MVWTKVGILIIGSLYALLLPYIVYKAIVEVRLNIREYTLSFLSNKNLYGEKSAKGYTWLLILTALLHYIFFELLSRYYFLGSEENYLKYINYSFAGLMLLACVRHNMLPYSFKTLRKALLRFGHNVLAVVVFLTLPGLIITFQSLVIGEYKLLGIGGFIIIGITIILTVTSVLRYRAVNGVTEILFINGISFWSIFVTIVTLLVN